MKTSLDHLPLRQQRELARVVEILHEEFADALELGTSEWKQQGRVLKIVLFGSYARGGWVDEPHTAKGYQSDFDILVIVNHKKLTDMAEFWYKAEDRLIREPSINRLANFIVHTMHEVNSALSEGQYFYSDIMQEGILLYELKGSTPFIKPKPLTDEAAYNLAKQYFDNRFPASLRRLEAAQFESAKSDKDEQWRTDAAFTLHQATEKLYSCYLLVKTNYTPSSHNIKFLRSQCERYDSRLIEAWPRETKRLNSRFELLKRAYVEARYSEHYVVSTEELAWLLERVAHLKDIIETVCQEHLDTLRNNA